MCSNSIEYMYIHSTGNYVRTVHGVWFVLYSAQCVVCIVQCTVCGLYCTVHSIITCSVGVCM